MCHHPHLCCEYAAINDIYYQKYIFLTKLSDFCKQTDNNYIIFGHSFALSLYDNLSYLSIIDYDIIIWVIVMKNNLRLLRKSRGYTQISVQMQTGIEQALLSKFETGERIPPTETLIRLANFYDVSIDYILCRTENPKVNL